MRQRHPCPPPPDDDSADAATDPGPQAPAAAPCCAPLEPIIGGTLALLTFYARTPHLAAADKIARNLALIARHPQASVRLQTVCTRLFLDWLGPTATQDEAPALPPRGAHPASPTAH
jgi:hypothetical protein